MAHIVLLAHGLVLLLVLTPGCLLAQTRPTGRGGAPPEGERSSGNDRATDGEGSVPGPRPLGTLPVQGASSSEGTTDPAVRATDAGGQGPTPGARTQTSGTEDGRKVQGTGASDSVRLREQVAVELEAIRKAGGQVSLLVEPLAGGEALIAEEVDAKRIPASNAKLLTTAAAALSLPGRYRFVTHVAMGRRNGPLYLWGTGDPLLSGKDMTRLAQAVRSAGVRKVRGIVVDDRSMDSRKLAPGFDAFQEGSHYRPTSGAINVDGNAVEVRIRVVKGRTRPRVDVLPPSDYVKVENRLRLVKGKAARSSRISIKRRQRGSVMWLSISGSMGKKAAPYSKRLAVYDPSLNAGWTLRRALEKARVKVQGSVSRGAEPKGSKTLASKTRSLAEVLLRTNRDSNNLCAETLVRAMGAVENGTSGRDSFVRGLAQIKAILEKMEIGPFLLANGSGLHRGSWVTARTLVNLLRKVQELEPLKKHLTPTLAVAGKAGTLGGRLRGTAAQGLVMGKTGTLGNALALSGYVDLGGTSPLVFSLLVNGPASSKIRMRMDAVAVLLARHAKGLPLTDEAAAEVDAGGKEGSSGTPDMSVQPEDAEEPVEPDVEPPTTGTDEGTPESGTSDDSEPDIEPPSDDNEAVEGSPDDSGPSAPDVNEKEDSKE